MRSACYKLRETPALCQCQTASRRSVKDMLLLRKDPPQFFPCTSIYGVPRDTG